MDELVGLLAALLFWRVVLATLLGLSAALLLALIFPAFGGGPVLLLTLVSLTAGLVWQAAASAPAAPPGAPRPEEQPVARPIAFAGIAVIGLAWGGVADHLLGSSLLAFMLLLAAPFVVGPLAGAVTRRPVYLNDLLWACAALAAGFFTPWAIAWLFA